MSRLDAPAEIKVIDSHTGGEPTRLVISGGPDLGIGTALERRERFRTDFDRFRSAIVNEPRGSDVMVGALLVEPTDPSCAAGVIFFNNTGYLGMCGHGLIGLVATLAHLGRATPGDHRIETPVGVVTATLDDDGTVSFANVPSFRQQQKVVVTAPNGIACTGDVAWGGNWFYLIEDHGKVLELSRIEELTEWTWAVRRALNEQGFPSVDHIELTAPSPTPGVQSRNFVLCPGKAFDRSPCGTGTSAKLACLFADRKLREGERWRQESITGSIFEGWVEVVDDAIIPHIKGSAHVIAESTLLLDPRDPICWGMRRG